MTKPSVVSGAGAALAHGRTSAERKKAAIVLGAMRSNAKTRAARLNGKLGGRAKKK